MTGNDRDDVLRALRDSIAESRKLMDSAPAEAMKLAWSAAASARELKSYDLQGEALVYFSRAVSITDPGGRSVDIATDAVEVLSREFGSTYLHAMALNNLGNCLRRNGSFVDALDTYEKAKKINREIDNSNGLSSVLNNIGITYSEIGHYQKAYQSFEEAIESLGPNGNDQRKATSLSNIASILIWQGEYDAAEETLLESLQVNREIGRMTGVGYCYSQLGLLKARINDHPKASEYLRMALSVWRELGSRREIALAMCSLAESFEKQENMQQAREFLEKACSEADHPGLEVLRTIIWIKLTCFRFRIGERDNIMDELIRALEIPKDSQDYVALMTEVLETLAMYCIEQEDFRSALDYRTRSFQLRQQEWEKKEQEDITRFRNRIEYEKLQLERDKLRNRTDQLEETNRKLQEALHKVNTLSGMLPICARCKKVRNDKGYWEQIERYITEHSLAVFSHGFCPDCMREMYHEYDLEEGSGTGVTLE
jgi:tetratricopeptide (TPR) repeat protein